MDFSLELPDLLAKLKIISYGHFQVDQQEQQIFVTLFTHQRITRYRILESLSAAKQAELTYLLNQYRS